MNDITFKHIMLDFETLGLDSNAIILSIGAVEFNPWAATEDTCIISQFYLELSQDQPFRSIDIDTLMWRKSQTIPMPQGDITIQEAMEAFDTFLIERTPVMLWAQGADFDFPKLETSFAQCKLKYPWKYNSKRDLRTLISLCPGVAWPTNPNKHNALSDATYQAIMVQRCMTYLKGTT